jgi:hypothetical protein
LIRIKEESPLEEELSINFVIVIHAFRFLIKGSFLMFKLSALLSVLLLSACASTTNDATPDYASTPATPAKPNKIEYSPNVKPTTSSFDALGLYLDDVIHGGTFSSNWCKNSYSFRSELFAPMKYEILSKKSDDTTFKGSYSSIYKVRIWSTNKGGEPIVADWSFIMSFENKNSDKSGKQDWCVHYIHNGPL